MARIIIAEVVADDAIKEKIRDSIDQWVEQYGREAAASGDSART